MSLGDCAGCWCLPLAGTAVVAGGWGGVNFCLLFLGTEGMPNLCPQSLLRGDRARAACSMLGSGGFEQSRAAQLPIAQGIAGTRVLCVRVGIKTLLGSLFLSLNNK